MVDVISAVSGQSSTLRLGSQSANASPPSEPAARASAELVSSHIRVDNLQNVAILEYRSSQTGEVVRQYPSQSQIDAFRRAERSNTGGSPTELVLTEGGDSAGKAASPLTSTPPAQSAPTGDTATSVIA